MSRPKCYFARPISRFGTPFDRYDLGVLDAAFDVIDPAEMQDEYEKEGMDCFKKAVLSSDVLVWRPFYNGKVGAGVWAEVQWAYAAGIPVLQLAFPEEPMTVEETRRQIKREASCGSG